MISSPSIIPALMETGKMAMILEWGFYLMHSLFAPPLPTPQDRCPVVPKRTKVPQGDTLGQCSPKCKQLTTPQGNSSSHHQSRTQGGPTPRHTCGGGRERKLSTAQGAT